jgi:thioredoxin-like negative regulator of GroEL
LEASAEYASRMVFLRLNINDNKRWQDFGVRVIPTLLYFKEGKLVARQDIFPDVEEIRKEIHKIIKS